MHDQMLRHLLWGVQQFKAKLAVKAEKVCMSDVEAEVVVAQVPEALAVNLTSVQCG